MSKSSRLILVLAVVAAALVTIWVAGGWLWGWVLRMHGVH